MFLIRSCSKLFYLETGVSMKTDHIISLKKDLKLKQQSFCDVNDSPTDNYVPINLEKQEIGIAMN